ncbi:MAG: response regulator transcription factor [Saprospiraceae bacterium]|nr:response regulator transcription factor [Saprospiraceae bacterium]MCF8250749.1 response regulator transcription factor [Saprospiraceae bacterium]MCF8279806.1 response regulator transcription factor [Bacteroidales bacterium]MCF8310489.1 response regulator transcription factor [Saprospiraceae bacterium]MCF8440879.1 response regulator transcription factor [Saprospiraceae bacterium]
MNKHQQIKVFIADDHPIVLQGVSCVLSNRPEFQVVGTAISGDELARKMLLAKPNVLLLDLNMPGKDFYENINWVKANAPWVKILIYTSYHSTDLVRSLIHGGVAGYLPKTASPSEISNAIQGVFSGEIHVTMVAHAQTDIAPATDHASLTDDFRKRLCLSRREQEILVLISRGLSSQRIGQTLYISKHTVETHRKNILRKLDFNSSTELVKFAVQQRLV